MIDPDVCRCEACGHEGGNGLPAWIEGRKRAAIVALDPASGRRSPTIPDPSADAVQATTDAILNAGLALAGGGLAILNAVRELAEAEALLVDTCQPVQRESLIGIIGECYPPVVVDQRVKSILVALSAASVEYLVVGGVAVIAHGHLRTTSDLDLVVRLDPDNVRRAIAVLTQLGFRPRPPVPAEAFADPDQRELWFTTKNMVVFSLWDTTNSGLDVDLFIREPFDFVDAYRRRLELAIGSAKTTVIALADLLALKRDAGRPQDLADIAALVSLHSEDE